MFYKINSKITGGLLEKQKDNDRIIIVYHWNSCGHCQTFMPILYNLLREQQELAKIANIFEVEYDDFKFLPEELTNVQAFPSVVSIQNGKKVGEFSDQRTPENLEEFIKENRSIHSSSYESSPTVTRNRRRLKTYSSERKSK